MTGPATASAATTTETAVIKQMLDRFRAVGDRPADPPGAISPNPGVRPRQQRLGRADQLFIVKNVSLTNAAAATQSLAAIDSTESGEFLLQEDTLVSAPLAARRPTRPPASRSPS